MQLFYRMYIEIVSLEYRNIRADAITSIVFICECEM